jgi:hypothetical protein
MENVNPTIPHNSLMTSIFDQAFYHQNNSHLRLLMYDDQGIPLEPNEYLLVSIPFKLINPEKVFVENVVVANENNESMQEVEIEIRYESPDVPVDYMLSQNYPNPFNPSTFVKFSVPKDEYVIIKVYDMIGQEVTTLYSGNTKTGIYTLNWDGKYHNGKHVSSGSYIYRMTAGKFVQSKKMLYIK